MERGKAARSCERAAEAYENGGYPVIAAKFMEAADCCREIDAMFEKHNL